MASTLRRTTRMLVVPATFLAVLAGPVALSSPGAAAAPRPASLDVGLGLSGQAPVKVVVSGRAGGQAQVRAAVLAAGGSALRALPIIDGWSARVPARQLAALARAAGVVAVTKDRDVHLTGTGWDESVSASAYTWTSQATESWAGGFTGAGVTVAVLDTGVGRVQDLSGRLLNGPDLSGEGQHAVDSYGHGTVMAGIVAGSGAGSGTRPRTGVAPGANIVSVKVAGANGATDVSTVLAGLSWVGAFKDTYGIKVLNLSWGVPSTQDPAIDPLNYAVERLWGLGVTVVVAAGNSGPNAGTVMKPGDDPLVLTVGAYDDRADNVLSNDVVPAWSSQGPTAQGRAKPDLVAPGRTLIATRAPGSTIEIQNPKALIGTDYIKGSGTSQAAAVASGVVALLAQAHPTWTPDQLKGALVGSALPIPGVATTVQGAGRLQAQTALTSTPGPAVQQEPIAAGTGTLAASRGTMAPVSVTCEGQVKVLNDETTTWCAPWNGSAWTGSAWTGSAWTGISWSGSAWTGSAWTGSGYDEATPEDTFLTAFFGTRPHWYKRVNGEVSEPGPRFGYEKD